MKLPIFRYRFFLIFLFIAFSTHTVHAAANLTIASSSIAADGKTITVHMNNVSGSLTPSAGVTGFTVKVNNAQIIATTTASGNTVTIIATSTLFSGQTVTLDLANAGATNLKDTALDTPTGQTGTAVTNNSTQTGVTLTATSSNMYFIGLWTNGSGSGHNNKLQGSSNGGNSIISLLINGTDADMQVADLHGVYLVTVDGVMSTTTITGSYTWQWLPLFSGLSTSPHTVVITVPTNDATYVDTDATVRIAGAGAGLQTPTGYGTLYNMNSSPFNTEVQFDGNPPATSTVSGFVNSPLWDATRTGNGLRFQAAVTDVWVWATGFSSNYVLLQDGKSVGTGTQPGFAQSLIHLGSGLDGQLHTYEIISTIPGGVLYLSQIMLGGGTGLVTTPPPAKNLVAWYGDSQVNESLSNLTDTRQGEIWQTTYPLNLILSRLGNPSKQVSTFLRDSTAQVTTLPVKPRIVVLEGGGNDWKNGVTIGDVNTAGTFAGDEKTMIWNVAGGIPATSTILVRANLPDPGGSTTTRVLYNAAEQAAVNAYMAAATSTAPAYYISTDNWVLTTDYFSSHPNIVANAKVANRMIPLIWGIMSGASYTVSGPSSGLVNATSTSFTVAIASSTFTGDQKITVTDNGAGGIFASAVGSATTSGMVFAPATSTNSFTFTYTPASTGTKTLTFSNAQVWTDAAPVSYLATALVTVPTVTAQAASLVATSSMVLNGTITADGGASSTVEGFNYGLTTSYGSVASSTGAFNLGSFSQAISGLTPSTTYHYQAFAINSGGTATSSDATSTTSALPAPIISSIASSTTQTTATITWTTDQNASSTVNYGANSSYGFASTSVALVTSHTISLSGLSANTLYHFQVGGSNSAGTVSTSTDLVFTTPPVPDTTPPSVAITTPVGGAILSGANVTLTANSSDNITVTGVQFSVDTTLIGPSGTTSPYSVTWNSNGVSDGSHTLYAVASDAAGNHSTSSVAVTVQNTSPVITSIASSTTQTTATITWSTNNTASSTVNYGTNSSYGSASTSVSLVTSHSIVLSGLTPSTTYHFQVGGTDVVGNMSTSSDQTFRTSALPPPVISSIASSTTQTTATITWTTDQNASSTVNFGSTSSYGTASTSPGLSTSHSIVLSGLFANTLYHFQVGGANSVGTVSTSTDKTFTTLAVPDTTPPTVVITAPLASTTVSGTVILTSNSSDNIGVAGVQFKIDGINTGSSGTTSPYSISWNSAGVSDGMHTISAVANDAAGNYATSSLNVTVDNTAPLRSGGSPNGTLALNTASTTISLTTNEAATCKYATTAGVAYSSMTVFTTTGGTSHSSLISGLSNGGSYIYYVKCSDVSDNTNVSDYTISFTVTADSTSPVVTVTAPLNNAVVSGNSVALTASATDDVSVSGVQFELDGTPLQSELLASPYTITWDSTGVADGNHSIAAVARDGSGNYSTSSIVTVKVDNTPPVLSNGAPSGMLAQGTTIASLSLSTNENATCHYSATSSLAYASMIPFTTTGAKAHVQTISGLSNGSSYIYYVKCQDQHNNTDASDYLISFSVGSDITPPIISSPSSGAPSTSGTTITWTTNENADSQVNYGTSISYGSQTSLDSTLVTSHSVVLSGLSAGTTYHYQIVSKDASSNVATSSDQTFVTAAPTPAPVVFSGDGGSFSGGSSGATQVSVSVSSVSSNPLDFIVTPAIVTTSSVSVSSHVFNRSLTIGSKGNDVKALQGILISEGYLGSDSNTGYFGTLTQYALSQYQAALGVTPAAGYFGPLTMTAIDSSTQTIPGSTTNKTSKTATSSTLVSSSVSFTRNLALGIQDAEVISLQHYLNTHGYIVVTSGPGSLGNETAYFGSATQAALAEFQTAQGISPASGYFGPVTRGYMNSHF